MNRLYEINGPGGKKATFRHTDLPLAIGSAPDAHIPIEGAPAEAAFIGHSEGHLFLQPGSAEEAAILHNNLQVTDSTWIKSGDVTRINNHYILYEIRGDVVTITITDTAPPMAAAPVAETPRSPARPLPRVRQEQEKKKLSAAAKAALAALTVLFCAALYLVMAQTVDITITPAPDDTTLSGFPPPLTIGGRLLAVSGEYRLTARKSGYHPLDRKINISSGNTRFAIAMTPLPGRLTITTDPEINASILINDKPVGTTPLTEVEVEAGTHLLRAHKRRYLPTEQEITVEGRNRRQAITLTLEPNWGKAALQSVPEGATITIDGEPAGKLTPAVVELEAGEHRLGFSKPLFRPKEITLSLEAGQSLSPPPVRLVPSPGTVRITGTPAGASVAVDSVFIGKTPIEKELAPHTEHTVTVTAPGYAPRTIRLTLGPEERRTVEVELQPQYATVFINHSPVSAEIIIDGKKTSSVSGRFKLLAAPHTIEVRAENHFSEQRRINPAPGSVHTLEFRLEEKGRGVSRERINTRNLVALPPGRFTMGSPRREQGRRSNEIAREVELDRPFLLAAREVTNAEFRKFKPEHSSGSFAGHSLDRDNQPVVNISWQEAAAYANWLSAQDGLPLFYTIGNGTATAAMPPNTGYRLPTEAEWAYAARAAMRAAPAKYGWQGGFPPTAKSGNFADETASALLPVVIKGYSDGFITAAPVGSFTANPAGLYDMEGNVSEWCHDFYSPATTGKPGREKNPLGPETGTHHVVRGASWRDGTITEIRLSYRGYSRKPMDDLGFRIARYLK